VIVTRSAFGNQLAVAPAALRAAPCVRVGEFLPPEMAAELRRELEDGIEYERVELGDMTRQWRAARPVGEGYFGSMLRRPGWHSRPAALVALEYFDSPDFVDWLSLVAGEELQFLRPVTAYKLGEGDRICLHDDMSDPSHAVSVAYGLSSGWRPEYGGATIFGDVTSVARVETPWDCPFELNRWEIAGTRRFVPGFNSLLIMRLGTQYAHGVEEVTGSLPRLSVIGIYGRR
jgi:hypothetical protein